MVFLRVAFEKLHVEERKRIAVAFCCQSPWRRPSASVAARSVLTAHVRETAFECLCVLSCLSDVIAVLCRLSLIIIHL